jgi:acyl-coenzyme A synthetase/AMP-(fatty) acid ligase/anti-sigma regulatory factor (Ser/Thr protein kinase)/thioesterase domain-containing protein/acyl carrier protein
VYSDETVLHYLKYGAANFGDSMAVTGTVSLSYAQLDDLSDRVAAALLRAGVARGENVGMGYDYCHEALLSVLGILKAGAVYVPLNPKYPEQRIEYMKNDAGIKVVLGGRDGQDVISLAKEEKVELPEIGPEDRMAIVYTSGSSGVPKGVILNHKNPMGSVRQYAKTVGLRRGDVMATYVSQSFIIAMNDFCASILTGATLCHIPQDVRADMLRMAEYFINERIAHIIIPASLGREFAKVARPGELRSMTFIGEQFALPDIAPDCSIYDGYGTTELAGFATIGDSAKMRPVDGVSLRLNERGELVVSGPCVGEAYLNAGAPFGGEFCTGDLAEIDDDGKVSIFGRSDFQVKIRGNRVQPEEIDFNARKFPDVSESVTVVSNGSLSTYFTGTAEPDALKQHLERNLPEYMVPPVVVRMESLPRGANGKIDLAALRGAQREGGQNPFRTETERWLAGAWSKLFGKEISSRDDIFEKAGGDSLTVMILALQIESGFGKIVSPVELLRASTLEAQAALIDAAESNKVVVYNEGGRLAPLFFAHSANSGAESYRNLMAALPTDQPFYVFENHNILFSGGEFEGIAELAQRYVGYLLPLERYRLGGWSLGGLIAFEMGLILQERGVTSELYLIDPYIVTSEAERKLNEELETEPYYRDYLNRDALFERFRGVGLIERLISNNRFVLHEAARYSPSCAFDGRVVLFRTMKEDSSDSETLKRLWEMKRLDNGFAGFTKELHVVQVDSAHDSWMNDPQTIETIVSEMGVEYARQEFNQRLINVPASEESLETVRIFISRELLENNFTAKAIRQTMIAVEEIFVNIAHYAYEGTGDVEIAFYMEDGSVVITFADSGKPYNPLDNDEPDVTLAADDRSIGGLGILMTRHLTDEMEYEHKEGRNILRIRKKSDGSAGT